VAIESDRFAKFLAEKKRGWDEEHQSSSAN